MGDGNSSVPDAFVFSPSQAWDGNDGRWSTFIIRVGTPEQNFRILPSTSGQEIFIPVPEGCTSDDPSNCGSLRGAYPFNGKESSGFQTNVSSTWKDIGLYNLLLEQKLNYTGNGMYGFDTVGLMLQNSGGLNLTNRVVAGIATKDFYLGIFGLGPKPSNFTDFDYPQPSFMRSLRDENKIPSLSFAYTAGASYRNPKLPGSLTLGGYDSSRFTANDQTFPFNADDSKVLTLGVQRITAMNTLKGSVSLLDNQVLSLIDSTVPHIWLPREACDRFQEAFGLTYDPHTDLYLVNDTIHEQLQQLQPGITFSLGNENNPAKLVTIGLPYGAFDLQASHPIYENATNYFPIRRAANDTQYTLGRAFLQEAYVIADYERSNFSVHQALFESPMPEQNIISILTPSESQNPSDPSNPSNSSIPQSSSGGLPKGAAIGIGVGVGILVLILALIAFIFYKRRKAAKNKDQQENSDIPPPPQYGGEVEAKERYELYQAPMELQSGRKHAWELEHDVKHVALMSDDALSPTRHEMSGNGMMPGVRHELPGDGEKRNLQHELEGGGSSSQDGDASQKRNQYFGQQPM